MSKTNPFAGLMAGFRGARAEDEKQNDEAADRAARRAEEDDQREKEDARRAEEDARRAEEDGPDGDDKPAGKGKKKADDEDQDPEADSCDDDDDAEDEMDEKEAKAFRRGLAVGRARENIRGSRIFLAAAEVGRPDLAATLAFTTRNSSAGSERLISAAVSGAGKPRGRLDERMGSRSEPRPGAGGGAAPKPSFGERTAAAVKKIRS